MMGRDGRAGATPRRERGATEGRSQHRARFNERDFYAALRPRRRIRGARGGTLIARTFRFAPNYKGKVGDLISSNNIFLIGSKLK